jgi:hypothetical protein
MAEDKNKVSISVTLDNEQVNKTFTEIQAAATQASKKASDDIENNFSKAFDFLKSEAKNVSQSFQQLQLSAADSSSIAGQSISDNFESSFLGVGAQIAVISTAFTSAASLLGTQSQDAGFRLLDNFQGAFSSVGSGFSQIGETAGQVLLETGDIIDTTAATLGTAFISSFNIVAGGLFSLGSSFFGFAKDVAKSAGNAASNFFNKFTSVFKKLPLTLIAVGVAAAGIFAGSKFIESAAKAEVEVNRLNQSLRNAGRFSQETSKDFLAFATSIEKTTTLSGGQVTEILALANNFAKTNEEAKKLTTAAIELSAATGKDVNSSLQALTSSLQGSAGALGKTVPEVKNLTAEQLKAGEAVDLVAKKFAGSAASALNTYDGALLSLGNAFDSLFTSIGNFIVKSPAVVAVLKVAGQLVSDVASSITKAQGASGDVFKPLLLSAIAFGKAVVTFVITPFEVLANVIFLTIRTAIQGIFNLIELLKLVPGVKDTFDVLDGAIRQILGETVKLGGAIANLKIFDPIRETAISDSFLLAFQKFEEAARESGERARNNLNPDDKPAGEPTPDVEKLSVFDGFSAVLDGANSQLDDFTKNARKGFNDVGKAAIQGIGTGVGGAFAAFGKAISTGENALEAFGAALLQSIGQTSIQIGTNFILLGAAYTFAGDPRGPGLLAAGAALAAFGGILAGAGGGKATAPTPGTPGGVAVNTQPAIAETDVSQSIEERQRETRQGVNVVIEGSVFDSSESGLRIVELIDKAFNEQGVSVRRGAFA